MASAATARVLARAAFRTTPATFKTTATRHGNRFSPALRQHFRYQYSRRGYADAAGKSGSNTLYWLLGLGAIGGGAGGTYYYMKDSKAKEEAAATAGPFRRLFEHYEEVYNAIAKALEEHDDYDDGSYGPVLLRLAWHASGTYDAETKTGGSNGATMRFAPEKDHGANAGLQAARDFLEPIKARYPWIGYSDLWILGGVAAIQEMQGPIIPWRPGRKDHDISFCTPDGRLPDGSKEQKHLRGIFYRMGFNDQEIVALSGAHALGRCHTDRSGFDGPWTFSPTVLTNDYYKLLVDEQWQWRKWDGPRQFEDVKTKSLMMLPSDMALVKDKAFRQYVEKYARDNDAFFADFAAVVTKLFELGVPFQQEERYRFKPLVSS